MPSEAIVAAQSRISGYAVVQGWRDTRQVSRTGNFRAGLVAALARGFDSRRN